MNKLCFMFGHRDAPASIFSEIERAVELFHLEYEIDEFIVGNHGSFDHLAAQAVRAVQKRRPGIRLTLILAYHPSTQNRETLMGYDGALYPDGMENIPPRFALPHANQQMIRRADALICYVSYAGNARKLLMKAEKQAEERRIPLINLGAK